MDFIPAGATSQLGPCISVKEAFFALYQARYRDEPLLPLPWVDVQGTPGGPGHVKRLSRPPEIEAHWGEIEGAVVAALSSGALTSYVDDGGDALRVPKEYWKDGNGYGRSTVTTGRLLLVSRTWSRYRRFDGQPCLLSKDAFAEWMAGLEAMTTAAEKPPETHSGMPGRPSAKHLYLAELERRGNASPPELAPSRAEQARVLLGWMKEQHPGCAPGTERTITNNIGSRYREMKSSRNN
jgi:hypothetical protein